MLPGMLAQPQHKIQVSMQLEISLQSLKSKQVSLEKLYLDEPENFTSQVMFLGKGVEVLLYN